MTALKETCIALHSLAHCQDSSSSLKDEGGGAVRSRQMFRSKLHGGGKAMSTHVTRGERWQKKGIEASEMILLLLLHILFAFGHLIHLIHLIDICGMDRSQS